MNRAEIFAAIENCEIIDISQSISEQTPVFPGDTPFSYKVTMELATGGMANVSALTMSPHVGTHADSPNHMNGKLAGSDSTASGTIIPAGELSVGALPLSPYIGQALVVDLTHLDGAITLEAVTTVLNDLSPVPKRILFKTRLGTNSEANQIEFSHFTVAVIDKLAQLGVLLIGIDTPSVDASNSESLEVHHRLIEHGMYCLENLELSRVQSGQYCLIALPLKFAALEASPVRAVLLEFHL